jgi:hypothetical protein
MRIYVKLLLTVVLIGSIVFPASPQPLPASVTDRIDSLFRQWDRTSSPGLAVGIVRGRHLLLPGAGLQLPDQPERPSFIYGQR